MLFFPFLFLPCYFINSLLFRGQHIKPPSNNIIDSCKIIEAIKEKDFYKNKKLITISPGGYKGFYTQGICIYIKEKYDIDNYLFSGASAGAWNALFMTCKKDIALSSKYIIDSVTKNTQSIFEIQNKVKENILNHYKTDDFELEKLFIGVTTLHGLKIKTTIYSNFCSLEDAIDCCFASSHIPFITGNMLNTYKNVFSFDGGFSRNPYFDSMNSEFHITPGIWDINNKKRFCLENITTLFSKDNYDCNQLLIDGYNDAETHKEFLDNVFLNKKEERFSVI
jgi:hypothetical protein